jgi:nucleotide-binding universal stress UspA family protein
MRTILVPLDGSALAEQALPYARLLAPPLRAGVCLLRVVSEAEIERVMVYIAARLADDQIVSQIRRRQFAGALARRRARRYLAAKAAELRVDGLEVQSRVGAGAAAEGIINAARQTDSALIAMASHGWSGLSRWALGSVADKVVQASETPVLILRSGSSLRSPSLRRIMLPLDGSELAQQALPVAVELAAAAQAELVLFQAVAPVVEAYPYPPLPSDVQLALRDKACQDFEILAGQLRRQAIAVTPVVALGYPAEAIVDEAERREVDLIVMATHGRGGLYRWALGSIADKVLHASSTPLLLVRGFAISIGRSPRAAHPPASAPA